LPTFSPEVQERSVRMVWEHEGEYASRWEAIRSIAGKMGCSAETLRKWLLQSEVDAGRRGGVSSAEQARVKELERENRELRRAAIRSHDPSWFGPHSPESPLSEPTRRYFALRIEDRRNRREKAPGWFR
jgi:transposase